MFATLFDDSQIAIWFWPRSSVPASVSTATSSVDISDWGTPSANYTSTSCDIASSFAPQQLVLDITLCGDWTNAVWEQDGCPGQCSDFVANPDNFKCTSRSSVLLVTYS